MNNHTVTYTPVITQFHHSTLTNGKPLLQPLRVYFGKSKKLRTVKPGSGVRVCISDEDTGQGILIMGGIDREFPVRFESAASADIAIRKD